MVRIAMDMITVDINFVLSFSTEKYNEMREWLTQYPNFGDFVVDTETGHMHFEDAQDAMFFILRWVMSVDFIKIARIRVRDITDDFMYWADYEWYDKQQRWHCRNHNSGFFDRFPDIEMELTDEQMLVVALKYT